MLLGTRCSQTHVLSCSKGRQLSAQPRQAPVVRPTVALSAIVQEASSLPTVLEESRRECLSQARIGVGERGRGLFFAPVSPRHSAASALPTAPAGSQEQPQPPPESWQQGQQPRQPAPLLSVTLSCCLALVTGGGPTELQQKLLAEWQSAQGLALPDRLTALLEATDQPPALRLAAWLLWATQVVRPGGEEWREESGDDCAVAAVAVGELRQPTGSRDTATASSSNSSSSTAVIATSAAAPLPPAPEATRPPPQLPAQPTQATGQSQPSLLAEYARHVMPPLSAAASLLRLADEEEQRLPGDVRAALRDARGQVMSYTTELRRTGLDWGLSDAVLWWAFDMVTSRSFAATAPLPPPPPQGPPPASSLAASVPSSNSSTTTTTTVSLAFYVPWACLLNHSPSPNAAFHVDLGRRAFHVVQQPMGLPAHLLPLLPPPKPLPEACELVISYGEALDNVQLAVRYGFCVPGNPNDRLPLPPELAEVGRGLRRQALCSAAEQVADGLASSAADGVGEGGLAQQRTRVYAALASLLEPVLLRRPHPQSGPGRDTTGLGVAQDGHSRASSGTAVSALPAFLLWLQSAYTSASRSPPEFCLCEGESSSIPPSAQVACCPTCASVLHDERRLLARNLYRILEVYSSFEVVWG